MCFGCKKSKSSPKSTIKTEKASKLRSPTSDLSPKSGSSKGSFRESIAEVHKPKAHSRPEVFVAIDLGTTYSGVAAWRRSPANPENLQPLTITRWPGDDSSVEQKVPTVLHYDSLNNVCAWGSQTLAVKRGLVASVPGSVECKWFKLHLDPVASREIADLDDFPLPPGLTAVDVCADYLSKIRQVLFHAFENIGWTAAQHDFHYILTHPASWSDSARAKTKEAFAAARFVQPNEIPNVILMSEPEAAAKYCARTDGLTKEIRPGNGLLVVDAGGGTVDLVAYQVTKSDPFVLKECTVPTGGICGSSQLDRDFKTLLEGRLSRMRPGSQRVTADKAAIRTTCLLRFEEQVKRNFGWNGHEHAHDIYCGLVSHDYPEIGFENNHMTFSNDEMTTIFTRTMEDILDLIRAQLARIRTARVPLEAIIFVGGFALSPYLLDYIKEHTGPQWSSLIRSSPGRELAVVHGAALDLVARRDPSYHEGARVEARRTRCHYVMEVHKTFDPSQHPKVFSLDGANGDAVCRGICKVLVAKNTEVTERATVTYPFFRHVTARNFPVFKTAIYAIDSDKCPEFLYSQENPSELLPGVRQLCVLSSDFTGLPFSEFKRLIATNGQPYYEVNYDIRLTIDGVELKAERYFKGKCVGSAEIKWD
ncbi:actin-like ATPase domain-containing protein [Saitoella complicata NRRL Y-17804]|uniref:Actin-like ATPase domain-containing protein n=1 Tax=Saitoella complicata (strain BCRC 22490 / CBS 7301 / JCM 7358 / NBRC 10748 / NRRL Y-17804) TaxID=698492 RepID=A0A0E9N9X9_SAICN|nr:actin-like ATPase domain-containing protein [Saitoella complicata NRRL Y-17804]ODQ50458.1 actin-like ATPase domain-containing protein [Saitoella complicata NRRL Y-17804]GAO46634.1 hypothetical protein G7K_0860-t1 [Saitoella complicata NRRL Y-17804]